MVALSQIFLTLAATILLAGCGFAKTKDVAKQAVNTFHQQYNDDKLSDIYLATAQDFKISTREEDYMQFMEIVRRKMGLFKSASETGWNTNITHDGIFVTLHYKSQYERGSGTEDFTFIVSGVSAKLLRVDVNSPLLPKS